MESDGRIRSKDIGTGEVNSRALDNIRSSNFDGSHTDPETNPGTQGWQILKNGFVVINNAIIRGTLLAGKIISGTLNIGSGGSITVGDEADPLVTLDESGLQVGDAPVVIDATGVQVGTDVVIDSTGLNVIGGLVTPVWTFQNQVRVNNASLTTTETNIHSVTITPPSWVQTVHLVISHFTQISDASTKNIVSRLHDGAADITGSIFQYTVTGGQTNAASFNRHTTITSFPFTVHQRVNLNSGTNSSNQLGLGVFAFGVRN